MFVIVALLVLPGDLSLFMGVSLELLIFVNNKRWTKTNNIKGFSKGSMTE